MIGSVLHHSMIPWYDDVDVYVKVEDYDTLIEKIKSLGLSVSWMGFGGNAKHTGKIYNSSLTKIGNHKHTYPFVDIFAIDCSDGINCVEKLFISTL